MANKYSFSKIILMCIELFGVFFGATLILHAIYSGIPKIGIGSNPVPVEVFYREIDSKIAKGFFVLFLSMICLAQTFGWRQKRLAVTAIFLGVFIYVFLPLPKLGLVVTLSGMLGFFISRVITSLLTAFKG